MIQGGHLAHTMHPNSVQAHSVPPQMIAGTKRRVTRPHARAQLGHPTLGVKPQGCQEPTVGTRNRASLARNATTTGRIHKIEVVATVEG